MRVRCTGCRPIGASTVPSLLDAAVRERRIFALDRARLQLAHEIGLRRERLGDDEQSARILVEAVHDARAGQVSERRRVSEQRIQQRAAPVAAAGMHDESRGLVDRR